jgi:hypothetical protein
MTPPSLFHRPRNHVCTLEIWIVGFLCVVDYCSALVMEIMIFNLCFCAEDYCVGVVTYLCSGIETCGFPRDDTVLCPLLLAYLLLPLVLVVLLYAYVLVGPLVLVVW